MFGDITASLSALCTSDSDYCLEITPNVKRDSGYNSKWEEIVEKFKVTLKAHIEAEMRLDIRTSDHSLSKLSNTVTTYLVPTHQCYKNQNKRIHKDNKLNIFSEEEMSLYYKEVQA